jgi:hypothetical protein
MDPIDTLDGAAKQTPAGKEDQAIHAAEILLSSPLTSSTISSHTGTRLSRLCLWCSGLAYM